MGTSKPWSTTIALGQRILEELKCDYETDTLGRWLAHYLAEKMERATSAPKGDAGEPDRRECIDLILRLWEHRQSWPLSAPLKDVADRLDELLTSKPRFFLSAKKTSTFLDLLHGLEELHRRETQVCLAAWAAGLDLSKDREFLLNHSEHLDDPELKVIQRLVEIQDTMLSKDAHLDNRPCADFSTLSKAEQGKLVRASIREIAKLRTQLLRR